MLKTLFSKTRTIGKCSWLDPLAFFYFHTHEIFLVMSFRDMISTLPPTTKPRGETEGFSDLDLRQKIDFELFSWSMPTALWFLLCVHLLLWIELGIVVLIMSEKTSLKIVYSHLLVPLVSCHLLKTLQCTAHDLRESQWELRLLFSIFGKEWRQIMMLSISKAHPTIYLALHKVFGRNQEDTLRLLHQTESTFKKVFSAQLWLFEDETSQSFWLFGKLFSKKLSINWIANAGGASIFFFAVWRLHVQA